MNALHVDAHGRPAPPTDSARSHTRPERSLGLVEAIGHAAVRAVRGRPSDGKAHY